MYYEKLHISQFFSNLECSIFKLKDLVMCNLYTKFVNFLECSIFGDKGYVWLPEKANRRDVLY